MKYNRMVLPLFLGLLLFYYNSYASDDSLDIGQTSADLAADSLWRPSAVSAVNRVLQMIGIDEGRSARSTSILSTDTVVKNIHDSTTPFLSGSVNASRVYAVELRCYWPPVSKDNSPSGTSELYATRAIIDSATGRLYEIRLSNMDSKETPALTPSAITERTMKAMDNQRLVGFPLQPPTLSLLDAVASARSRGVPIGPVESADLIVARYVLFQSDRTSGVVAAWEIYCYAPIDFGHGPIGHLRNVLDANTGEAVCRTSNMP